MPVQPFRRRNKISTDAGQSEARAPLAAAPVAFKVALKGDSACLFVGGSHDFHSPSSGLHRDTSTVGTPFTRPASSTPFTPPSRRWPSPWLTVSPLSLGSQSTSTSFWSQMFLRTRPHAINHSAQSLTGWSCCNRFPPPVVYLSHAFSLWQILALNHSANSESGSVVLNSVVVVLDLLRSDSGLVVVFEH